MTTTPPWRLLPAPRPAPAVNSPRATGREEPNSRRADGSTGWSEHDLGPARVAPVEVLVAGRRLVERQLVRHDERRVELAGVDQVAQLAVVALDVALAGPHALAL